jgi:hypothetical protein
MTTGKAGLRQRRHHLVPFGSTADKIRRHERRQDNGCPDDYGTIHRVAPTLEHSGVDAKARSTRQIDPK